MEDKNLLISGLCDLAVETKRLGDQLRGFCGTNPIDGPAVQLTEEAFRVLFPTEGTKEGIYITQFVDGVRFYCLTKEASTHANN